MRNSTGSIFYVIKYCENKDWSALKKVIDELDPNCTGMSSKILVSAFFETYQIDPNITCRYGLTIWDNNLYYRVIPDPIKRDAVNLNHFFIAYDAAKRIFKDEALATQIKRYVILNKKILCSILSNPSSSDYKKTIIDGFDGDIPATPLLSKAEKIEVLTRMLKSFKDESEKDEQQGKRFYVSTITVLNTQQNLFYGYQVRLSSWLSSIDPSLEEPTSNSAGCDVRQAPVAATMDVRFVGNTEAGDKNEVPAVTRSPSP